VKFNLRKGFESWLETINKGQRDRGTEGQSDRATEELCDRESVGHNVRREKGEMRREK